MARVGANSVSAMPILDLPCRVASFVGEQKSRRGNRERSHIGIPYGSHGGFATLTFTDMTTSPSAGSLLSGAAKKRSVVILIDVIRESSSNSTNSGLGSGSSPSLILA